MDPIVEQLLARMTSILDRLTTDPSNGGPTQIVQVVAESDAPPLREARALQASFVYAPLIVERQSTGLLGVFSTQCAAFGMPNVRFLFDIGQKAAEALSRIRAT